MSIAIVIDEVVRAARGPADAAAPVTDAERFAAACTALEASEQRHTPELLDLIATALPAVPTVLVRRKFAPVMQVLRAVHMANQRHADADAADGDDGAASVVPRVLRCIGLVLARQDTGNATWSAPAALHGFNVLVRHLHDGHHPAARAEAHSSASAVLQVHTRARSGTLAAHVAEYCAGVLDACPARVSTSSRSSAAAVATHVAVFLGAALPTMLLSEQASAALCRALLRLATCATASLPQQLELTRASARGLSALLSASATARLSIGEVVAVLMRLTQSHDETQPEAA